MACGHHDKHIGIALEFATSACVAGSRRPDARYDDSQQSVLSSQRVVHSMHMNVGQHLAPRYFSIHYVLTRRTRAAPVPAPGAMRVFRPYQ